MKYPNWKDFESKYPDYQEIAFEAFRDCSKLTSITIPKSVTWIGFLAFAGCNSVESITSLCVVPPEISANTFEGTSATIPVYVPQCSLPDYQADEFWNQFQNLQADEYILNVLPNFTELGEVSIIQQPDCEHDAIVLATPNDGVPFSGWMEDGVIVSTDNPYSFSMTSSRNLVACFGEYGFGDNQSLTLEVYPNPVFDRLTVKCEGVKIVEIKNPQGQSVAICRTEGVETSIDVSHLPAGIYFVGITIENGKRFVRKVMKE